jgi:uncharacterized glyoxalase superfamily protein PhnB
MHASLSFGETTVMVSDGVGTEKPRFEGFSLSLTAPDEAAAKELFATLSDGERSRCRWPRVSSLRFSAWSPIALA